MSILALVSHEERVAFERKAAEHRLDVVVIESPAELTELGRAGKRFSVAILPASLPETGIWALWGQVQLLNPRPEVLVYARSADFATWSGVLEAGGYDILLEPFSAEQLQIAVQSAQESFDQRIADEAASQTGPAA